jgi:flagellar biosynthesis protein FlhA
MASLALSNFRTIFSKFRFGDLGVPFVILVIMAMLVIPLPAILLDILFTFNLLAGTVVIMIAINTKKPLDFSSFPSVLLLTTMLRLALNVASTRVVLVDGHHGADSAGKVIQAFGEFVIHGNYLVGFIIFSILMIINFIVITKGAGRVSEVIARFTLDAMPGKQMAIDADLNAGVISQDVAKVRRAEVAQEAEFFGAMDGASKFVRGDAIAGIMILAINIFGGLIIGVAMHSLSVAEAAKIYTLLTIGDGLVAQIPAMFLSLATAIIVTRVTTAQSMTEQAATQLGKPTPLFISAAILMFLGLIPGMPHAVFLFLGAATVGLGYMLMKKSQLPTPEQEAAIQAAAVPAMPAPPKELDWNDVEPVDLIGLEIGYALIPLVNPETGGQLMSRVKGVRKKLSTELGFLIPAVRIRDALNLEPETYNIVLNGVVRATGQVRASKELAINPGKVYGKVQGETTREAAFGLEAVWIDPSQRDYARTLGYTVVDPSTAVATHLNKVLRENAHECISHDETQQLLDKLAKRFPKLVEDLSPTRLPLGTITRVLQNLLSEGVPIRDMRSIAEALVEESGQTQDPIHLTALIRPKLGRFIVQNLAGVNDSLSVMTLAPNLEQMLRGAVQQSLPGQGPTIEPGLAESLFESLRKSANHVQEQGHNAVLVVSPSIRPWLAKSVRHRVNDMTVLSYSEIPDDQSVKIIYTVDTALR